MMASDVEDGSEIAQWRTIQRGWVSYLEDHGPLKCVLAPGDAAKLALLLREAQPPIDGTSQVVLAYRAAKDKALAATSATAHPLASASDAGFVRRARRALAEWLYRTVGS
jgi:hypothetical protein